MADAVLGGAIIGATMLSQAATANVPPPLWQNVTGLGVLCLVSTDRGVDTGALHDRVCARARAITAAGAPVPVAARQLGDREILAPGTVTLMVHARATPADGRQLLALSIRPFRNDHSTQDMLFGAAPRAVLLGDDDAALDAAIAEALDETLPWREPGARPLPGSGRNIQPDHSVEQEGVR